MGQDVAQGYPVNVEDAKWDNFSRHYNIHSIDLRSNECYKYRIYWVLACAKYRLHVFVQDGMQCTSLILGTQDKQHYF